MKGILEFDNMTRFFMDRYENGRNFDVEKEGYIVYIFWEEVIEGVVTGHRVPMEYSWFDVAHEMYEKWNRALDTVDHDYTTYMENKDGIRED